MVIVSARLTRRWWLSYRHDIDERCPIARLRIAVRGACDFSWISRLAKDQQQLEFHASPLHLRRRISLALLQPTPGDSGANASVGGLVWPSGLSRRPDWISALSGSFQ